MAAGHGAGQICHIGVVGVLPFLVHQRSRRDAVLSGLLAGPLAMLPGLLFFLSMIAFYPAIGDRFSPKEWNEKGRPDILSRAIAEKKRILAERFPRHVPKPVDDRLRARFGEMIKLPRSGMGA